VNIYVSGSLAYDRIMEFPGRFADHILPEKIHILNVSLEVNGLQENFGGTAGNIAYSLALMGERPTILATAGCDFERYRTWLEQHNIATDGIEELTEEFTAGAYITTDKDNNQFTGFNPGAMKHASSYNLDGRRPEDAIAIVAPGNIKDMLAYPRAYKERGIRYICDPGQQIPVLPPEGLAAMIDGSAMLTSNDYELEMICKAINKTKAEILEMTGAVITTLGEHGSLISRRGRDDVKVGAAQAEKVKDPTGAGDAYRAGLIKGLIEGKSLPEAAAMGSVCGSFAVERHGTQAHAFTMEEFWARHRAAFGG